MALTWTNKILKARGKAFMGAIQEYNTPNGVVAVCFSTSSAYVFEDEEGCYTAREMKGKMQTVDSNFPEMYEPYTEIIDINKMEANPNLVARLGLSAEDVEDIKVRLDSLSEYSEEHEVKITD